MRQLVSFCLMLAVTCSKAEENDQPFPSAAAVAAAFHFPISKLKVENVTKSAVAKCGEGTLAAWAFTSQEKIFAPVNAVVTEAGTLLTEAIKTEFETKLAETQGHERQPIRRVQIGEATGFGGLAGFGPGGAALAVTLHLPAQNLDLQVSVNIAFMDRTDVPQDLADYARLFNGGGDMLQSLIDVSSDAAAIVANRFPGPRPPAARRSRLPAAADVNIAPTVGGPENTHQDGAADDPMSQTKTVRRFTWTQVGAAVFVLALFFWSFRRIRHRQKQ